MKTIITSLLIALSIATSSASFAQDNKNSINAYDPSETPQTTIFPVENGKVDVVIGNTERNALIQVIDKQGKTLVSKPIDKDDSNTRIRFDLNELPDGVYEVVVTQGNNRQVKDVILDTHTSTTYRTVTLS